jgi:cell division protein FtsB
MRSSTETLIKAMRILATDIQSDDGVANAAIAEAAQRLEEQQQRIKKLESDDMRADLLMWSDNLRLQQRIAQLERENDALRADLLLWNEKEGKL